jgi:hypothetical protein
MNWKFTILLTMALGSCQNEIKTKETKTETKVDTTIKPQNDTLSVASNREVNADNAAIKQQAEQMGKALLMKDYKTFLKWAYPPLLKLMGGNQKMLETLELGNIQMEEQGTTFISVKYGEPSTIIQTKDEWQCTLPQIFEMKINNGKLIGNSTLICISNDNGKTWYFIDSSDKSLETIRKTLPNISAALIVPTPKEPIFIEDKKQ